MAGRHRPEQRLCRTAASGAACLSSLLWGSYKPTGASGEGPQSHLLCPLCLTPQGGPQLQAHGSDGPLPKTCLQIHEERPILPVHPENGFSVGKSCAHRDKLVTFPVWVLSPSWGQGGQHRAM